MDCEISARNEGRRRLHRRPRGQVNKFPTGAAEERQEKHGPSRGDHRHLIVNQLGRKRRQSIDLTSRCIGSRGWKWECKTVSDVGHSTKAVQRVEDQLGSAGCRCWHPRSGSARFGGQVGGYHENRLNVSRLQKNRFKPSPDQAGVQPLRQRICFEPDPRNREAKSFKELDTVSLRW